MALSKVFSLPSEEWSTLYDKNLLPMGTHFQKRLAVQKSKQEVTKVSYKTKCLVPLNLTVVWTVAIQL